MRVMATINGKHASEPYDTPISEIPDKSLKAGCLYGFASSYDLLIASVKQSLFACISYVARSSSGRALLKYIGKGVTRAHQQNVVSYMNINLMACIFTFVIADDNN